MRNVPVIFCKIYFFGDTDVLMDLLFLPCRAKMCGYYGISLECPFVRPFALRF